MEIIKVYVVHNDLSAIRNTFSSGCDTDLRTVFAGLRNIHSEGSLNEVSSEKGDRNVVSAWLLFPWFLSVL